jgi:squalene synthase HpnC
MLLGDEVPAAPPNRPPSDQAGAFAAPSAEAVMARAGSENFPVASRVLPAAVRGDLLAVYGFARLVDELGDSIGPPPTSLASPAPTVPPAPADRLAALDWLEGELDRAFAGAASHPLMVRLQATIAARSLPRGPFERLIEANRLDQHKHRYKTWEELRGYCALSADPVGELVLGILDSATPEKVRLSDSICTALQLTEHCQDVAEDLAAGRVYLPQEDLDRFGCTVESLAAAHAEQPVRAVLAFEVERARALFDAGAPLLAALRGRPRFAVAAFLEGGRAALTAIERAGYDVLGGAPLLGPGLRAMTLARALRAALASGR